MDSERSASHYGHDPPSAAHGARRRQPSPGRLEWEAERAALPAAGSRERTLAQNPLYKYSLGRDDAVDAGNLWDEISAQLFESIGMTLHGNEYAAGRHASLAPVQPLKGTGRYGGFFEPPPAMPDAQPPVTLLQSAPRGARGRKAGRLAQLLPPPTTARAQI
jgi:hypothetical protein